MDDKILSMVQTQKENEESLHQIEERLQQTEEFKDFLQMQKQVNADAKMVWEQVERLMIKNNVRSVKNDYITITIAERLSFDTTDELQPKFYKKVVDTKKLADTFRLNGKAPKGATPKYKKYLTKRVK